MYALNTTYAFVNGAIIETVCGTASLATIDLIKLNANRTWFSLWMQLSILPLITFKGVLTVLFTWCWQKKSLMIVLLLDAFRRSRSQMFFKIGVLKNFSIFTWKQVFSCKYCGIFKNTFFNRIPPVAASDVFRSIIGNANHHVRNIYKKYANLNENYFVDLAEDSVCYSVALCN